MTKVHVPRALLAPWRRTSRGVEIYLQRRDEDAEVLPGHMAFFGGKIVEGESPEQALEREIMEELSITPTNYSLHSSHDSLQMHIFTMPVASTFDELVTVNEGQYGEFMTEEDVENEPLVSDFDRRILGELFEYISL